MFEQSNERQAIQIADRLQQGFATLLEAFDYATDTRSDPWDFAVPIRSLRKHRLTEPTCVGASEGDTYNTHGK